MVTAAKLYGEPDIFPVYRNNSPMDGAQIDIMKEASYVSLAGSLQSK